MTPISPHINMCEVEPVPPHVDKDEWELLEVVARPLTCQKLQKYNHTLLPCRWM